MRRLPLMTLWKLKETGSLTHPHTMKKLIIQDLTPILYLKF